MYEWKCPVCGKEIKNFSFKEYSKCPKTTLFGNFKVRDLNGNVKIVDRKYKLVCSEECKRKNEEHYFVEEYNGCKIYCVNGKYIPYLECNYYFDSIDDIKKRIDNKYVGIYM